LNLNPFPRRTSAMRFVCAGMVSIAMAAPAWADSSAPDPQEKAFLADNDRAMATMMSGMAAKPTGDIDKDFVAMMQPHHQGAIDMAIAELRYGHNEQLRRIAQEIIVDQQQEITAMRVALDLPLPSSGPAPTLPGVTTPASSDSQTTTPHSGQ
jgi:hypothetical protein